MRSGKTKDIISRRTVIIGLFHSCVAVHKCVEANQKIQTLTEHIVQTEFCACRRLYPM